MPRTEITIIIGRNIRYRRLVAGLSQRAVGKHLGVSAQQVQKYESGASGPSCESIIRLAGLLNCSVDELCDGLSGEIAYEPLHPWNPHRVLALMANFNRIRSHALRDKVCGLVKVLAELEPSEVEPTL